MAQEKHLEELLFSHPYLIDPEFTGLLPQRQKVEGPNRLDLLFNLPDGLCIDELKKTRVTLTSLKQLLRYCRYFSEQPNYKLASHHYLIGKRPVDESWVTPATLQGEYVIRVRYVGEHIPLHLAWDESTRRYYPFNDDPVADRIDLKL